MSNWAQIAILSLLAVVVLVFLLQRDTARIHTAPTGGGEEMSARPRIQLVMYCAAGIKRPVEQIAKGYQEEYGVEVQLQSGGSGTLLSSMQVARSGDLYLAADTGYIEIAQEKGLIDETLPLAWQRPVIVASRWRTLRTVLTWQPKALAVDSSLQAGPSASTLSRMWACLILYACALPFFTMFFNCTRSASVNRAMYFFISLLHPVTIDPIEVSINCLVLLKSNWHGY